MFRMNERLVAAAVLMLAATAAGAQPHRYQQSFERDIPYRAGVVTIDHRFGSVAIRTGEGSHVSVRASIRASDPAFGQQIRVTTAQTGKGVTIRTEYPEGKTERNDHSSYSVDLQVAVPRSAPVHVTNRFGSLQATAIAGGSSLVNGHGSITLAGGRGDQSIQNSFGSIHARDIEGNVHARNSHGSIHADRIRGAAVLENRFGSVHAENVERETTITNSHGSVHVNDIGAATRIVASFGSAHVEAVEGPLQFEGNHARVNVRGIGGNADVSTTFAAVDVDNVRGTLRITNNNGSVKAAGIQSDTVVRTSFGSASLQDIRGAIDVENQSGTITVSEISSGRCRPISLRTSDSSIRIAVPSRANYAVNARTTHGRVSSTVPIASATTSASGARIVGTIGSGGCKLDLVNSNGNITIAGAVHPER